MVGFLSEWRDERRALDRRITGIYMMIRGVRTSLPNPWQQKVITTFGSRDRAMETGLTVHDY